MLGLWRRSFRIPFPIVRCPDSRCSMRDRAWAGHPVQFVVAVSRVSPALFLHVGERTDPLGMNLLDKVFGIVGEGLVDRFIRIEAVGKGGDQVLMTPARQVIDDQFRQPGENGLVGFRVDKRGLLQSSARQGLWFVKAVEKHQLRRHAGLQADSSENLEEDIEAFFAAFCQPVGDIDLPGLVKLQVRFDGQDQGGQFHRVLVDEVVGPAAELGTIGQDMVDEERQFPGIAVRMEGVPFGEQHRHRFVGNGEEHPVEPLDLVVMGRRTRSPGGCRCNPVLPLSAMRRRVNSAMSFDLA